MIKRLRLGLRHHFEQWIDRRLPQVRQAHLGHKNIFIFPSWPGFALLVVIALLWLLAINYQNNLIFGFCLLLAALFVVNIFHSYANLADLRLSILGIGEGFPGEMLPVSVEISQSTSRHRGDIWLSFADSLPICLNLSQGQSQVLGTLYVRAKHRGRQSPGRLRVETSYPLGLMKVWTLARLDGTGIVYPRPVAAVADGVGSDLFADGMAKEAIGSEDYYELNPYRRGESLSRIAWKHFARGRGLLSKSFADPPGSLNWLDWEMFPGLDREARLSRLCYLVLQAFSKATPYGLRLPGQASPLGEGGAHRDKLLRMLALFEAEES